VCYCTWCAALVLLDVVGSGCGALRCGVLALWRLLFDFTVLAPYNAAPHNPYQPHAAEPTQHTTCSNTRLVLLKMGIMMPETCWESVDNKHLTVASCWFSLSLHNFLTMHGHRNLKIKNIYVCFIWLLIYFKLFTLSAKKRKFHYLNLTPNMVFKWHLCFFHITTSYYKHFCLKYFYKCVPDDSFYKSNHVACNLA